MFLILLITACELVTQAPANAAPTQPMVDTGSADPG
jgi:hypothetical protein